MPGGDRTGPLGMGPMTGRGAGFCAGYRLPRRAFGMGFGRGRGFNRMFGFAGIPAWPYYEYPNYGSANVPAVDEKEFLSKQADFLENQLEQVKKHLKELAGDSE